MGMARIIPGVAVKVVKEVVPQQLSPSGVLGIAGFIDTEFEKKVSEAGVVTDVIRAGSWNSFMEECGRASAANIPEARQALENGVYELVIAPISSKDKIAQVDILTATLSMTARYAGTWANTIKVQLSNFKDSNFDLQIFVDSATEPAEEFEKISLQSITEKLGAESNLLYAQVGPGKETYTFTTADISKLKTPKQLAGGVDAADTDYDTALQLLTNEPDVDMVIASLQATTDKTKIAPIYSKVIAHCKLMSDECKGRIGFGQVRSSLTGDEVTAMVTGLVSDRFVMIAPEGSVGAVAGMIGNLSYYESPTFKRVYGIQPSKKLSIEEQRKYLRQNVVPLVLEKGKGVIVVRGLTTDGDQVNVRRIADRSVRGVKMIGDLFIGRLNTGDGRNALKQKLIEFLVQMEKEGAIVPSTDGTEPAFTLDVYSSQRDFALGIVRVDLAVRPVRAIDYIYATILVEV